MGLEELFKEGEESFKKGDWASSSRTYASIIAASNDINDDHLLALAHYRKGYSDMRMADYEESVRHYMDALNISTAIDDIAMATDALRGLGTVHWQTGTYDMSSEFFKEAMLRASELEDKALLGKVKIEYGNLLNFQGELEKAMTEYKEAIELLSVAKDQAEESRAHNNLGDALYRLERFKESIDEFKTAIQLGEDVGHFSRVAWARSNCALALIELGQTTLAKDYIVLANDYMGRIGDKVGLGDIHEAMGLLFMMDARFEEAEQELKIGLSTAMELDVPDRKAIAERNLGRMYARWGRREKARLHLSRALAIFESVGMAFEMKRVHDMLEKVDRAQEEAREDAERRGLKI